MTFDIEMTDYNEATDVTTVRVSRTDNNLTLCEALVTFDADGDVGVMIGDVHALPLIKAREIREAIEAELSVHQSGPEGHLIETLRDLFNVVTPSGETEARAFA